MNIKQKLKEAYDYLNVAADATGIQKCELIAATATKLREIYNEIKEEENGDQFECECSD